MNWLSYLFPPLIQKGTAMIELAPTESSTSPAPAPTTHAEPAAIVIEAMHPRIFSADPLDADELERHALALSNPHLRGLAQRVVAARSRLLDVTGEAEVLSWAADAQHFVGVDPEVCLKNELTEVTAQIEQAVVGRKLADARLAARSARITPLKVAVSQRHSLLVRERDGLNDRLHLLRKGHGIDLAPSQLLRQAGLTPEQIAAVGTINPGEADIAKYTDRLAATAPEIAAIESWIASDYRDHQHLAGLGFDALITAAQLVGEKTAP